MPAIHYRLQQVDNSPSNSELDARIEELRRQIEDDTHKVIADVENKYSIKNPGSTFSDVQFPLTQVLHRCSTALDDLEKSIVDLESEVGALNIGPRTKLDALRSFTAHLQELYDVEEIYKRVNEYDIAHDYAHGMKVLCEAIPKLAGIAGSKDGKVQKVAETMVDDFCFKKVYFVHNLKESFRQFISCSGADAGKVISLTIHPMKKEKMNAILEALSLADSLDSELDNLSNLILEGFCSRIVESATPSESVKIQKTADEISFNIFKNVPKGTPEPLSIVEAIFSFLKAFGEAVQGYKTDSHTFASLLGTRLQSKLADLVIKKCLTPAVPYEKEKIEMFEAVKKASDDLHSLLITLGFFPGDSASFSAFSENFDQIFITRRCARICEKARDLALETCSEEVNVGTTTDSAINDDLKEFMEDFETKTGLKSGKLDIGSDSQLPKILQFRKCRIARNVRDFGDLLTKTLDEACTAESDVASGKLLTTGSNIVRIFLMASSKSHDQVIKAVPLFGALFYNGCHYIAHVLILSSLNLKAKLPKELVNHANFISLITELRQVAADTLEGHLLHMRRDISTLIGPDDIFANLMNASALSDCRKVVESCLRQVKQVSDVWKGVFSDAVYVRAVGAIISHTLGVLVEVVLTKEDITEDDSTHMAEELSRLLKEFEEIMTVNGEQTIGVICEKEYHRTKEVLFCLKESLMNIADRWCNGKGPLAHWMKPEEVKKLIRAIFQNTDIRAKILVQIC